MIKSERLAHSFLFRRDKMKIRPPKAALYLWQFRTLTAVILLYVPLSFFGFYYSLALFPLWGIFAFFYLPLFFKGYRVSINNESIIIECGVIIKRTKVYNQNNIIYTSKLCLPDAQEFDLCAITLRSIRAQDFIVEVQSRDAHLLFCRNCRE